MPRDLICKQKFSHKFNFLTWLNAKAILFAQMYRAMPTYRDYGRRRKSLPERPAAFDPPGLRRVSWLRVRAVLLVAAGLILCIVRCGRRMLRNLFNHFVRFLLPWTAFAASDISFLYKMFRLAHGMPPGEFTNWFLNYYDAASGG
jgi:hypothetical protein